MMAHNLRVLGAAVLLVFLSATTIPVPISAQGRLAPAAFDCSTVTGISSIECQALVALYNSTNGAGWTNHSGWLTTTTPCSWYGVGCNTGHFLSLNLSANQLSGSIPAELGNLASLNNLDLSANQLSGGIPPQLGNLANLYWLHLNTNQLSGSIPSQLGSLANLQSITLSANQLSGSIPAELGNLASLNNLSLDHNQLSGSIPPQLGNLANLKFLALNSNQLRGPLPQRLTNLRVLTTFYFDVGLLCIPNGAFAAWLAGIVDKSTGGATCKTCYLPVLMR
jgi:Leucine rich repeat/Leucine rich repeat N-terminal domain